MGLLQELLGNLLAWSRVLGAEVQRFGGVRVAVHPTLTDPFFNYGYGPPGAALEPDLARAAAWMQERQRTPHFYLTPDQVPAGRAAGLAPDGADYLLMAAGTGGSPDPAVTPVGAAELPEVVQMLVAEYPFPREWLAPLLAAYRGALAAGAQVYALSGESGPAATLLLVPDGRWAGIYSVATARPERGRGLGSRLVRHALAAARSLGCQRVTLQVAAGSPAEQLYRRLGFTPEATVLGYAGAS